MAPWSGLIVDRVSKRKLLVVTQVLQVLAPLALWALTESGAITIWLVYALVFARGALNTVDNPARQSFVAEMVDADHLVNAVSLNASVTQAAMVTISASVQASLQLAAAPEMRGRIVALYQMVFTGTTPLGALVVGALTATVARARGCPWANWVRSRPASMDSA